MSRSNGRSAAAVPAEPPAAQRLELQYIEAGTLAENPANWRRHGPEQLSTLSDLLSNPNIGWAGALLYNRRTKRLIDGHARLKVTDPKASVPVLVGDWSEEAERTILATLDPIAAMASGDADAFKLLVDQTNADSLWVRELLHKTGGSLAGGDKGDDESPDEDELIPEIERQPFEHHDYIMLVFHNDQDFQQACELFGIKRVQIAYPGGKSKIGLGRVVDGPRAIERLQAHK